MDNFEVVAVSAVVIRNQASLGWAPVDLDSLILSANIISFHAAYNFSLHTNCTRHPIAY
jgi:hypothetical protein